MSGLALTGILAAFLLAISLAPLSQRTRAQNTQKLATLPSTTAVENNLAHAKLTYPETRKSDQVDDYFGVKVPDPYRWLEDENSPETAAWVAAENKVTVSYLN